MSTRSTTRHRTSSHPAHTHTPTPPLQRTSSRPGSSRPGTPSLISRGDIPFSRKTSSSTPQKSPVPPQPHQLPTPMSEQPTTPTPKKTRRPKRGSKPSQQRNVIVGSEPELGIDQEPSSEDEEMLFDLLGVTSPPKHSPKRGVLNLSKDDMDVALGKRSKSPRNRVRTDLISNDHDGGELGKHPRNENSPAPNSRKNVNRKNQRLKRSEISDERGINSEGDVPSKGNRGRKKGTKAPFPSFQLDGDASSAHLELGKDDSLPSKSRSSGLLSNTKPKHLPKHQSSSQVPITEVAYSSFDTSSLSKSLPARGRLAQPQPQPAKKKNGKIKNSSEDESAVWEMPPVAGGQELTWQQKLQSSTTSNPSSHSTASSPLKSNKSTPSDKKKPNRCAPFQQTAQPAVSSPLNPRPSHNRRASVDGVPSASATASSGGGGRTISAFDSHIPFHTGYNVHRAPQTPAKGVASAHGNISDNILPIVGSGEFPRLRDHSFSDLLQQRKGSLTATNPNSNSTTAAFSAKYAGPTFHNSPNAASLSKPDLEDF
ncbi:hypothetical protein L486_01430 [Kwoniella mangroviensis CBS 10435]|uniref:Uncharacterized protein n=1 Tax=Kwoniella mangroviensis CBS 10435 TaxID=1331196 RepID=A0A1B9J200_9TREE|nr:hypothetical protein L486_01430 [Kwoniella mangroviensis CBS 10435]